MIFVFVYSFDVRGRAFTKALHWSDPRIFGPRAYFVTISKPATLNLDSVQLDDEGIYRCRVDFKNSPSRSVQINLSVIGLFGLILFTTADLIKFNSNFEIRIVRKWKFRCNQMSFIVISYVMNLCCLFASVLTI